MRKILLEIGDGPDGVVIYTDDEQSVVMNADPESVWIQVSSFTASATFGPLLPSLAKNLAEYLK